MKKAILYSLVTAGTIASSHAAMIAYEGFDTAASNGSDATSVGTTGSGFSAYGNTNFRMDIEDGLSYTDGGGNTLNVTGKSAGMDLAVSGTQNLQLVLSSTISNSGTIYTSYLVNVAAGTSWGLAAGLSDSAVTDSASPTSALEAAFRSTSTNFGIYGDSTGIDLRTGPDSTPAAVATILVISELNMTSETMTTYINPSNLGNVTGTATHTISDTATTWDDMTHFVFSLGSSYAGTVDEIRVGTTLADVTPYTAIPEPSSLALLGLGGLALILRRKM